MFTNLHDAAAADLEREVQAETKRLLMSGKTSLVDAKMQARATVVARRGEAPTIAKAIHDQGGPISGGSV